MVGSARSDGARPVAALALLIAALIVALPGVSAADHLPAAHIGTLTVTPSTDLVDGQVVTVSGTGWNPDDDDLWVSVCSATDTNECTSSTRPTSDSSGSFSAPLTVRSTQFGYADLDCRMQACLVRIVQDYRDTPVSTPVSFRADGPLLYDPAVVPEADSGLVDGQVIAVSGLGWEPGANVTIYECNEDRSLCPGYEVEAEVDGTGAFTADVRLRAQGDIRRRGAIDCRVDKCFLHVVSVHNRVRVPLAFDPDVSPLPPPTVQVTPNQDLLPGQEVLVEASGFFPNQELVWGQCDSSTYLNPPDCYFGDVTADAAGRVSFTTEVAPSIVHYHGVSNCRPNRCFIGFSTFYEWHTLASLQLHQRADGDEHVAVSPTVGLHDGDQVEVDASGLNVGFDVRVAECVFPDPDYPDAPLCAPGSRSLPVDADGEVHATLRVEDDFVAENTVPPRSFDCRVDRCLVIVSGYGVTYDPDYWYVDNFHWRGEAITFAGASPAKPATPASVTPRFTG